MSKRLLIKNSFLLSNDQIVNLFVTENLITFRYLKESEDPVNSSIDILSHDLAYSNWHKPNSDNTAIIQYKDKKYSIEYECDISLDTVKNSWKAGQVCLICAPSSSLLEFRTPDIFSVDLYSNTYTTKNSLGRFSNELRTFSGMGAFLRFFPLQNQNFLTSSCALVCYTPNNLITNLEFDTELDKTDSENINLFYNSCNTQVYIKGPSIVKSNELVTLEVEVLYEGEYLLEPLTLKVECVDGYAPHKRVKIINGKGAFQVKALDLNPNETLRVKLNDEFFTSKSEYILNVV